jgi:mRNA interferase HigB
LPRFPRIASAQALLRLIAPAVELSFRHKGLIFSHVNSSAILQLIKSHFGTIICFMRIIALSTLKSFWEGNPEYMVAKEVTLAWYRHALAADWSSPAAVKQDFRNASILKDGRVVFNIAGNKYRLVVWINYTYRVIYIRFIGTHAQYDKIDVQTI